jgi:hypothetical protein
MHSESARSDAGFDNLPHIGVAGDEQPLYDDWDTDVNDPVHPPLTNPSRREGQFEKVTYPPHNQAPVPPTAGTTPPTRTPLSDASIAALRLCLPNLKGLDDNVFRTTNIEVLIQLNGAAQTPGGQGSDAQSAAALAAAAAAHFAQFAHRSMDPGVRMAKVLESLQQNPKEVPAGTDNRITILHVARFLAGTVMPAKKQWLMA